MVNYNYSILEKLLGTQIIGFNQLIPKIKNDNNRAMFCFDPKEFSFEFCNPGELEITYLSENRSFNCISFKAENFILDKEVQYPQFIINESLYNSDCFYHYLLNLKILEIEIYSTNLDSKCIDKIILLNCEKSVKILIECTISMNGTIKMFFINDNEKLVKEKSKNLFKKTLLNQ